MHKTPDGCLGKRKYFTHFRETAPTFRICVALVCDNSRKTFVKITQICQSTLGKRACQLHLPILGILWRFAVAVI